MSKSELSFEEFVKLCEEAGVSAPTEELEQDFRTGAAVADMVDIIMTDGEAGSYTTPLDGYEDLAARMESLKSEANKTIVDVDALRASALGVAATAIRLAADVCYSAPIGN